MSNPSPIPLFSAARVHEGIDLAGALSRVVDSCSFILGREVEAFEHEFARYVGVEHCVAVANGSDALELALRALDVGPGDRVACVANAAFYSATAIHQVGANPVFVDVDDATLTMSPRAVEAVLRTAPKAVIVTHLYGQLAAVEELADLCRSAGVALIEDCAQAHGARRAARQAGSFAQLSCFSFYPTKNLGALGDGGAVLSSSSDLAQSLRQLRQYGWGRKYQVVRRGGRNSRLDEMQAAVLREKLPHLDRHNGLRRAIARRYNAAFAGLPMRLPASMGDDYVGHLYVIRTPERDALRAHLQAHAIATDVHYPVPDHRQPVFAGSWSGEPLPVTESACASAMSLPCFPGLSEAEVDRVIQAVRAFFEATGR